MQSMGLQNKSRRWCNDIANEMHWEPNRWIRLPLWCEYKFEYLKIYKLVAKKPNSYYAL